VYFIPSEDRQGQLDGDHARNLLHHLPIDHLVVVWVLVRGDRRGWHFVDECLAGQRQLLVQGRRLRGNQLGERPVVGDRPAHHQLVLPELRLVRCDACGVFRLSEARGSRFVPSAMCRVRAGRIPTDPPSIAGSDDLRAARSGGRLDPPRAEPAIPIGQSQGASSGSGCWITPRRHWGARPCVTARARRQDRAPR
jgi:hypothetical protein